MRPLNDVGFATGGRRHQVGSKKYFRVISNRLSNSLMRTALQGIVGQESRSLL